MELAIHNMTLERGGGASHTDGTQCLSTLALNTHSREATAVGPSHISRCAHLGRDCQTWATIMLSRSLLALLASLLDAANS